MAGVVTSCQLHDSQVLGDVLDVAQPEDGTTIIGDGAYDRRLCYAAAKGSRQNKLTTYSSSLEGAYSSSLHGNPPA